MSSRSRELLLGPMRALRRSGSIWALSLVALVVMTIAFWPSFHGSTSLSDLFNQMPQGLVQAFGLQDFGSSAGYLRGNLYALLVPLLLGGAGVGFANGLTAAEEDSGRLEVVLTQPVSHRAIFLGRAAAVFAWVGVLTVATAIVQYATDPIVGLSIRADRLAATILLCGLLGLLHAGLCLAVAGLVARPSLVLGLGLFVLIAGCTVASLFPLSQQLKELAHLSPWDWALGGDPLVNPTQPWRYLALGLPAVGLALFGAFAFGRRDVRAA
jgi:ABC-2 type transport system permease protein